MIGTNCFGRLSPLIARVIDCKRVPSPPANITAHRSLMLIASLCWSSSNNHESRGRVIPYTWPGLNLGTQVCVEVTTTRRFHQHHQTVPSAPPDGRAVPPRGSVSTTRRFHQHHQTVDQYHHAVP